MNTIKRKIKLVGSVILAMFLLGTTSFAQQMTRKDCMEAVKKAYNVKFVYDASISVDAIYNGMSLGQVTDKRPGAEKISLEQCLDRLFEDSGIVWSRKGKHIILKKGVSRKVQRKPSIPEMTIVYAAEDFDAMADTLNAARVQSDRMSIASRTQTGLERLDASRINSGFALFNSPDVVKTLQRLPGVASGTELLSGLYVHGGTGSDNLFMLDGAPMYSTSHLIGLFSSFNTDVVENVDFYKSGFPARFGGRLSSVVDVSTREGDMYEWHGSFSVGLLDGRVQFEGPLVKGRTSVNVGLRRTWMDTFTIPAVAYFNSENKSNGEHYDAHYAFWDMQVGLTHILSSDDKLHFNFFSGKDKLRGGYAEMLAYNDASGQRQYYTDKYEDNFNGDMNWGGVSAGLTWDHVFSSDLSAKTRAIYSLNRSLVGYRYDSWNWEKGIGKGQNYKENNLSTVNDIILKTDFDWIASDMHHVRFGTALTHHIYGADRYSHMWTEQDNTTLEDYGEVKGGNVYSAEEVNLYAEDEITLGDKFILSPGLRYTAFHVTGKTYHNLEPRLGVRYNLTDRINLKASYTEMHQYIHLLSTAYLDLPTSSWLPVTSKMKPMFSRQVSAGVYADLPKNLSVGLEGFYRNLEGIYEYSGGFALYPPVDRWEESFTEGRGRSYGAELSLGWAAKNTRIDASYTLSWSKRYFEDFFYDWYFDRNDSRHMLNISATHKFSGKFEIYGGWTYHTGSRMTLAELGLDPRETTTSLNDDRHTLLTYYEYRNMYYRPNGVKLPDYHRLDIGMNFRKVKRSGNERIWNLSLYNAYCRMNALYGYIHRDEKTKEYKGMSYGVIPIIPTVSYTLKF